MQTAISFAPMEGITTALYRNIHREMFGGVARYYTPFISPTSTKSLSSKELRDVLPENNTAAEIVPQILTRNAEHFLFTAEKLKLLGYHEINLNLGCPSGTVVKKGKGSGFLAYPYELDAFFQHLFRHKDFPLSVKTRIGMKDEGEYDLLLYVFRKYAFSELILHPRLQTDLYKRPVRMTALDRTLSDAPWKMVYNGDIFTEECFDEFVRAYPKVETVMPGRGLIANPALARQIMGGETLKKDELFEFADRIYKGYIEQYGGDAKNAVYRMKELWFYMGSSFEDAQRRTRDICRASTPAEYAQCVDRLFAEKPLRERKQCGFHP